MRLASFQIKNYKVIDDTGPIKADELVTALVGKNESGKSSVMKAMWKSRNVADAKFDKLYDSVGGCAERPNRWIEPRWEQI